MTTVYSIIEVEKKIKILEDVVRSFDKKVDKLISRVVSLEERVLELEGQK